jgi:hypothetical protein
MTIKQAIEKTIEKQLNRAETNRGKRTYLSRSAVTAEAIKLLQLSRGTTNILPHTRAQIKNIVNSIEKRQLEIK